MAKKPIKKDVKKKPGKYQEKFKINMSFDDLLLVLLKGKKKK